MTTINEAAERERFEAWMRTQDLTPHLHYHDPFTLSAMGEYLFADIRLPWKAWKEARATLPQASGEPVLYDAVAKLIKAKGRFHTEQNYAALVRAFDATQPAAPEMQASHGAAVVEPIMGYINLETLDCAIAFYQNKIPDGYLPFYLAPVGPVSPTPSTDSAADARDAWISVEDRLPEVDEDGCANVWAVEIGSVGFSRSPQAGVTRYHKTLGWQPQGAAGWDWVITYWMPFPELPRAAMQPEGE